MSIANKLIYLNGTKEKLKESINNIGGSITNETTFRAYAEELDNIYSNIPKTTGEGSNLSLTTIKGRINVDDILGDTEQEGTPTPSTPIDIEVVTGQQEVLVQNINFLPSVNTTRTINGVTFTHNADGTILVNGTATANALYPISLDGTTETTNVSLLAGTYVVTDGVGDYTNYFTQVSDRNQYMNTGSSGTTGISPTVTFSTNVKVYARIFVREGKTVSNKLFKPMIVKSTDVSAPYTPYQEQTKIVNLSSKNLFNKNDITTGIYFGSSGTTGTSPNWAISYVKVKPNTNYYLSGNSYDNTSAHIVLFNESQQFISDLGGYKNVHSITTTSATKYIGLSIALYNGSADDINVMQLEEGTQATTYEPYYNYELAKIGTYQDRISKSSGKNYCLTNSSEWELGQYGVDGNKADFPSRARTKDLISIEPNTTIYVNTNNTNYNFVIRGYSQDKSVVTSYGQVTNGNTITTTNVYYLGVTIMHTSDTSTSAGQTILDNLGKTIFPMICLNSETDKTYEPYGSDKWYIEKNIGKANLSSFTWNAYPTAITNISRFATMQIPNVKYVTTNTELGNALATHYVLHTGNGLSTVAYNFCIDVSMVQATDDSTLTTPRGEMYYALATPTYTEITNETLKTELNEIEKMMSYNGQTNISISGNLPMLVSVSALKGE